MGLVEKTLDYQGSTEVAMAIRALGLSPSHVSATAGALQLLPGNTYLRSLGDYNAWPGETKALVAALRGSGCDPVLYEDGRPEKDLVLHGHEYWLPIVLFVGSATQWDVLVAIVRYMRALVAEHGASTKIHYKELHLERHGTKLTYRSLSGSAGEVADILTAEAEAARQNQLSES